MGTARDAVALVIAILVCFAAAGIGGLFTARSVPTWYQTIEKPSWTPPSGVFGPVWTVLYLMMGIAAWLVWRKDGFSGAGPALGVFGVQLALNALWSVLFFGMRNPGAGFAEIILLWVAIVATVALFWRVSALAGALLLPYLAWVTFAAALNGAIWRLSA
jgi:benzodiazapine receptor